MEFGACIARNHATLKRHGGNFIENYKVLVRLVVQKEANDGVRFIWLWTTNKKSQPWIVKASTRRISCV